MGQDFTISYFRLEKTQFTHNTAIRYKKMTHEELMREAIRLSEENIQNGGGPFGAIVAREGQIVGRGTNRVTANNDPTAHAEVNAIRDASHHLKTFDLSGCDIYTSCEPCPMCLGAIYWAHIGHIYYANNQKDAASIGFDDQFIYEEIDRPHQQRRIPHVCLLRDEASHAFSMWHAMGNKIEY